MVTEIVKAFIWAVLSLWGAIILGYFIDYTVNWIFMEEFKQSSAYDGHEAGTLWVYNRGDENSTVNPLVEDGDIVMYTGGLMYGLPLFEIVVGKHAGKSFTATGFDKLTQYKENR